MWPQAVTLSGCHYSEDAFESFSLLRFPYPCFSLQLLLPCGVFSHSGMWPVTCSCAIEASQSVEGYSIRGLRGHEPHLQGPEEPHLLQGQVASIKLLKKGPGYTGDGLLAWPEWTQKMKWGHQEELKYSVCNYSRGTGISYLYNLPCELNSLKNLRRIIHFQFGLFTVVKKGV